MSNPHTTYESGYDPALGYNKNAFAHSPPHLKAIRKVVGAIATPIGLISEALHDRKDKKSGESSVTPQENALDKSHCAVVTGEAAYIDPNEEDWALDDIVASDDETDEDRDVRPTALEEPVYVSSVPELPKANTPRDLQKLPFPVVIPQRRPRTKSRGFIRAYAPVLERSRLDQDMFLKFLKDFHSAMQAAPIFKVVQLTAGIAGLYPNLIVGLVLQAVQITATIAGEAQERWRGNKFLEEANRKIFAPRRLYAFLVTYKCSPNVQMETGSKTVDLGVQAVAKYAPPDLIPTKDAHSQQQGGEPQQRPEARAKDSATWKEKAKRLRISSGQTVGEGEMPIECAPLIFPALEHAAADAVQTEGHAAANRSLSTTRILSKAQDASKWTADYFDRRAQAAFAYENPDSTLAKLGHEPQFKSRFANPNDGTNKHLITLITGGRRQAEPLGARRRWEKAQKKEAERRAKGLKEKPQKRLLTEDVLYLMVVNMPTEEELEHARQTLKREKMTTTGSKPE